jgi:hypothetical protein
VSPEARLKRSRDNWKHKAGERGGENGYLRKGFSRGKRERVLLRKEFKEAEARSGKVETRSLGFVVERKVDLVFLALRLSLVDCTGFRAVSRMLGVPGEPI